MRKKRPEEPRESLIASGWTVEAEPVQEPAAAPVDAPLAASDDAEALAADPRPQYSNAALVVLGLCGGLYLLYAWIWLSWAQYYAPVNANLAASAGALGGTAQNIVYWIAPLAPILWFLAALLMNRGRLRALLLWIGIGAVVLVPLPVFDGWSF
ncbi:hypothetical protein [Leucobacter sp. gxy201]|uniref:hypothetical protein n=1 Tax=Leucobacter sp. gxy201 TaxID=2957200 RepID=UPI003DA044CA